MFQSHRLLCAALLAAGCGIAVAPPPEAEAPPLGTSDEALQCSTTYRDQYHNTGTACGTPSASSICGPTSAAMMRQTMTCGQCAPTPGVIRGYYTAVVGLPAGSCAATTTDSNPGAYPYYLGQTMMRVGTGKQFDDGCAPGTVVNHCTSSSTYTIASLKSDLSPANGYVAVVSGDMSQVANHCCDCRGGIFLHTVFMRQYDPATDKFEVYDPDADCNHNPQPAQPNWWTSAEVNAFSTNNHQGVSGLCVVLGKGTQAQPGARGSLADGFYCGGEHGMTGTAGVLYQCKGGAQAEYETCGSWCAPTPKGDFCAARHRLPPQVDIDGDGKADVCARAGDGVHCYLSTGSGFSAGFTEIALSDTNGWNTPDAYAGILFGDVNGDGKSDLCARASDAFYCWPSNGTSFGTKFAGPALTDASGWINPPNRTTVQLADVNGDGKADVCGRAGAGFTCWLSNGSGFPTSFAASPAIMSDAAGWNSAQYYSTIQTADLDGDGKADVCGRGVDGVHCYLSTGSNFTEAGSPIADFSDANGGNVASVFSTIQLGDVNGDGKADVCGRLSSGYFCWLSDGKGGFTRITGPALTDAAGWNGPAYSSTIQLGDVNGDGQADLCARGVDGWHCWLSDGAGFPVAVDGPAAVSDTAGWNKAQYDTTLQLGDVDGDGRADLCGRASTGWECWLSSGTGFAATPFTGPAFVDTGGWDAPWYVETIRLVGRTLPKTPIIPPLRPDAGGVPGPDASVVAPGEDAGESGDDAGLTTAHEDASATLPGSPDASARRADAGYAAASGACGCGAAAGPVGWVAMAALGLLGLRRRRS